MKEIKRQWSSDEDQILGDAIASVVQRTGRTPSACIGRLTRLNFRLGAGSQHWSSAEDAVVLTPLRKHPGGVPRGTWRAVARDLDRTYGAVIQRAIKLRRRLRSG